ncbi:MAG: magnesium transporter [Spirochaetales bacterium]|nr:magnesium transporter [Candidatus Physcosoma equi]
MDPETQSSQHPDYVLELVGIIQSNISPMALKEKILDYHENDIAEAMATLSSQDRGKIYRILDSASLANIFEYAEDNLSTYLNELSVKKKIAVLSDLETDKATDYLKSLPKGERVTLIEFLDDDARKDIALLASFDEDEIGSIMTTNFIEVTVGITVKEAMRLLIEQAAENDNIQTIYVTGRDHTYYGAVDLKDLIRARESEKLEEIVSTSYPYVYAHELIDDCVNKIKDYAEDSIPVLDPTNKLLGVITSQDMVEVIDEAMGDDYAKFASLAAEEDLNETAIQSSKKRLPWLTILLFLGMLVSSVVGLFEGVVARLSILVSFQSLVLAMAGNSGTQSLAITIRVLTDEFLSTKQKAKLVWKETRIGMANGAVLGLASFLVIGAHIFFFKTHDAAFAFAVSGCTGFALMLAMTISALMGTVIPIFFKKINVDPAVASGPLITTMNDLVAVITYYGMAYLLLISVLGYGV